MRNGILAILICFVMQIQCVRAENQSDQNDPLASVANVWGGGYAWLKQSPGDHPFVIDSGSLLIVNDDGEPEAGGVNDMVFQNGEFLTVGQIFVAIEDTLVRDTANGDVYIVPAGSVIGISPDDGVETNASCSVTCGAGTYACCKRGSNGQNPTCLCQPNPSKNDATGGNGPHREAPTTTAPLCDAGGVGALSCQIVH